MSNYVHMNNTCRKCHCVFKASRRTLCDICRTKRIGYNRTFYERRKTDSYAEIWRRTSRREKDRVGKKNVTLWTRDNIETIVTEIWKDRCSISGDTTPLVLCRWDNKKELSLSNHVCLCSRLARQHSAVEDPYEYYGNAFSGKILLKLLQCNVVDDI